GKNSKKFSTSCDVNLRNLRFPGVGFTVTPAGGWRSAAKPSNLQPAGSKPVPTFENHVGA
ncbi:MAG: hypothetical protein O7H40_09950, partial [Gammaproteobacteria bacterium]|nr:hypothetical protein [Gammaproteobacteria bacterium]